MSIVLNEKSVFALETVNLPIIFQTVDLTAAVQGKTAQSEM